MKTKKENRLAAGTLKSAPIVVNTTTYNIVREMNFSNCVSPEGGLQ